MNLIITDDSLFRHRFVIQSGHTKSATQEQLLKPTPVNSSGFKLGITDGIFTLTNVQTPNQKPTTAQDLVEQWRQRLKSFRGKNEPLARAFGWHKRKPLGATIDTTAGLGRDSIILAQLGAQVIMLERELGLACLLDQALELARSEPWFQSIYHRIQLHFADAQKCIQTLATESHSNIQGYYCDPMFEHKKNKTAQNKRLVQTLQSLCSRHESQLLEKTLCNILTKDQRLVIKRAPHIEPSLKDFQYKVQGKAYRLDVHFTHTKS